MGVLLIAGGILLWGDDSYGWRFSSAVFGAIGIALAYLLTLRLTRRRGAAILAACLLLLDGLYFVQSRTAMLDVFLTVFLMAAMLAFHGYLTAPPGKSNRFVILTGVFLGLAIATKWSAAYPAAMVGCVVLWRTMTSARPAGSRSRGGEPPLVRLGWIALGLGLVPAAIYLAAHIPFFAAGHSFQQFVELQRQTLYYHSHLRESHAYQSHWWQWPLALRPVWYHVNYLGDRIANVYANGNPVLSVAFVPAVLAVTLAWWKRRDPAAWVLAIGFLGQWLPWALVPRISFAYHFLPATPFGCIAVAVALDALYRRGTVGRVCSIVYVAAVAASFAYFYPIYAAVPLSKRALEWRFLLPSWR